MTLQKIKSLNGKDEYVLLPVSIYRVLRKEIEGELAGLKAGEDDYEPFAVEDYVDNPVALARIKARATQEELARRMKVSQAYISKIEGQANVTPKVLMKVKTALESGNPQGPRRRRKN
ncbi:MAG: helix-turn-helix transcriptional regulator [Nitrospinae bacterium]|nr:helix-turn-helix transcriptional regulator [Nitrospinota bacterium]